MSCCPPPRDDFDPDLEGPSEDDIARFGSPTRPCPECAKVIYDEVDWCPHCGHAMTADELAGAASGGKTWIVVAGVIALAAFILVFVL